jgi:tetratricopeptide (TPR) repeat protein
MASQDGEWEAPTSIQQKNLQKVFEHASKKMQEEKCQFDYVTDLLTRCVLGDPSNKAYAESYVGNLKKKYANNRKGVSFARMMELGSRNAIKKLLAENEKKPLNSAQWAEMFKPALAILKINPWDVSALTAAATAAEKLGAKKISFGDCELFYLKQAQEANPKDADVNRQIALALDRRATYLGERAIAQCKRPDLDHARKLIDQAIACWHKVEQAKPDSEEPKRQIGSLGVKKEKMDQAFKRRVEEQFAEQNKQVVPKTDETPGAKQAESEVITPEERLKQKIAREPKVVANYIELAQLHVSRDRFKEAEEIFAKAFEVSGGNLDVQEKWEDTQLRALRQQLVRLKKRAQEGDEAAKTDYKRVRKELGDKDLEICKKRCERYPNNLVFKYDLGIRYKTYSDFKAAIKEFQQAQNDPRKKGICMLELGECFEHVKQPRLAMGNYESAVVEIPDREPDSKMLALYRAGTLAMKLNDIDLAEKHLTTLAGMDFSYKDVSALLDKIGQLRNDNTIGQPPAEE